MKWNAVASTILAMGQLLLLSPVNATATCKTVYATTSTTKVPTSTTRKTSTVQTTETIYATSTETLTLSSTFTVTIASTTSTVPTGANFTPIISAKNAADYRESSQSAPSRRRREAVQPKKAERNGVINRRSPAASSSCSSSSSSSSSSASRTKFPHSVGCTTVTTRTRTHTTTSTEVDGAYVGATTTVTTHVATATAYAACGADNVISTFHGHDLGGYAADHSIGICFTNANSGSGTEPCMSAEACCGAAQKSGYSGWQFTNYTGGMNSCTVLAGGVRGNGGFVFYSGAGDGHVWFGNTVYGGAGVFGGPEPSS